MEKDLLFKPASELARLVKGGEVTSRELTEASLERIEALDPELFSRVDHRRGGSPGRSRDFVDPLLRADRPAPGAGAPAGQRRYDTAVLGKLGFIGVAQSAGFKLGEIKELIDGVDSADGMGEQMRSLSARKLDEVEALLERTKAMKGWLEVAKECGCASPAECALFAAPGEEGPDPAVTLRLVRVEGTDCRRDSAPAG